MFYEDAGQAVNAAVRVVRAADARAAELPRRTLSNSTPTLVWTQGSGYGDNP